MSFIWKIGSLSDFSAAQFLRFLTLRQDIFLIEQQSLYRDLDNLDFDAIHFAAEGQGEAVAYGRLLRPDMDHKSIVLGRLVVSPTWRNHGMGRDLVQKMLHWSERHYPECEVRLSAQVQAVDFYRQFGFQCYGEPYDDGGIEHIGMVCNALSLDDYT